MDIVQSLVIYFKASLRLLVTPESCKWSLRTFLSSNILPPNPNIESIEMPPLNDDTASDNIEEEEVNHKDELSHCSCILTVLLVLTSFWLPRNYEVLKRPELLIYTKLYNIIYTTVISIFVTFSTYDFKVFKIRNVE